MRVYWWCGYTRLGQQLAVGLDISKVLTKRDHARDYRELRFELTAKGRLCRPTPDSWQTKHAMGTSGSLHCTNNQQVGGLAFCPVRGVICRNTFKGGAARFSLMPTFV